jgi:hypothetical protein
MDVFRKSPQKNNLNNEFSNLLIRWLKSYTGFFLQTGIKNSNESIQTEQAQNKLGTTQEPAGSTKIHWRQYESGGLKSSSGGALYAGKLRTNRAHTDAAAACASNALQDPHRADKREATTLMTKRYETKSGRWIGEHQTRLGREKKRKPGATERETQKNFRWENTELASLKNEIKRNFRPTWAADMCARLEGTSRHNIRLKAASKWKQQQRVNRSDAVPARCAPVWREGKISNLQPHASRWRTEWKTWGPARLDREQEAKIGAAVNEIGSKKINKPVREAKSWAENKSLSASTQTPSSN